MLQAPIVARLNYMAPMAERPRYHVVNTSRDVITRDPRMIPIEDARLRAQPPSLALEGFALFRHKSAVSDFTDQEELARVYPSEIERLVLDLSGADQVTIFGRGTLRFGEHNLPESSHFHVLRPARLVHTDISDATATVLRESWRSGVDGRSLRRYAHYNIWRVFTPPPQDIPLAVCDARDVSPADLVETDIITDIPGTPESSVAIVTLRYSPCHRWSYFSNMDRDEVLVFKSYDSDPDQPRQVPHSAFRNPAFPPGVASRASIEIRATAFWLGD